MSTGDPTRDLPYAWGGPLGKAGLKNDPGDFVVEEELGYGPDGNGEHAFLQVRKCERNTHDVARLLARHAGVRQVDIGYAGLKDRNALTTQSFTVHLPGRPDPDWQAIDDPSLEILAVARHSRKIRRGGLRGNRFRIRLRAFSGDRDALLQRLGRIAGEGVPNYFGPQRFGREGANLVRADAWFTGESRRPKREQQGILLSAVRAALFNVVLGERVAAGSWSRGADGDVMQLEGKRAQFAAPVVDQSLIERLRCGEVHPTGPLYGRRSRALEPTGGTAELEAAVAGRYAGRVAGLVANRLDADRRALRLVPQGLEWEWCGDDLTLAFSLGSGAYATTVLRELVAT